MCELFSQRWLESKGGAPAPPKAEAKQKLCRQRKQCRKVPATAKEKTERRPPTFQWLRHCCYYESNATQTPSEERTAPSRSCQAQA